MVSKGGRVARSDVSSSSGITCVTCMIYPLIHRRLVSGGSEQILKIEQLSSL
jgi:hypothetical protein